MSDAVTIAVPMPIFERLTTVLERMERSFTLLNTGTGNATDALLKIGDVATWLKKSERDVQRLVKAGKLKKVPNLGRRTTRFRLADVERLTADKDAQHGRRRL